jgi:hypothetical protein
MIGGRDIIYPHGLSGQALDFVQRCVRGVWNKSVVEMDSMHPTISVFFYKDHQAFQSWKEDGATPENDDTMIHLLSESGETTFVVASTQPETRKMVEDIILGLDVNFTHGPFA